MNSKKTILLVEDDQVDVMTVKRAFKELRILNPLECASNGEEALDYLRDPSKSLPCIILLDLNMPKMNGLEFLSVAKNDEQLKKVPVIVMTTSHDEQDKVESFNYSVAGYVVKPVEFDNFVAAVKTIDLYWTLSEQL